MSILLVAYMGPLATYMRKFGDVVLYDSAIHYEIPKDVDLVVFSGGSDVNPSAYGELIHPKTRYNTTRDYTDIKVIKQAFSRGIPCVGICRGAQILSVMNGDKLIQHVTKHLVPHDLVYQGERYRVTSTHHQMMVGTRGEVIAWSDGLSGTYEGAYCKPMKVKEQKEPEAVWYDSSSSLCVQFHPEHVFVHKSDTLFTKMMEEYIL